MLTTRWLRRCGGSTSPEMRLLCLPYGGSGASIFNGWRLPEEFRAEVWAAQPPGRENRFEESPLRRVEDVIRPLADAVMPLLDRPYVLFGHSMGALLAFELCRALRRAGAPLPTRLAVSAHRAPDLPPWRPAVSPLPEPQFLARLAEMMGPSTVAQWDPDLLRHLAPKMRADFEVCETYTYLPEDPLSVPVTCFTGIDDPEVRVDEMIAWRRHTTAPCQVYPFSGGHLFLREHGAQVLACLADDLRTDGALLAGGERP